MVSPDRIIVIPSVAVHPARLPSPANWCVSDALS
jgi:hypothetical protein